MSRFRLAISGTVIGVMAIGLFLVFAAGAENANASDEFRALLKRARAGDAKPQCRGAFRYLMGTGVARDEKEAMNWYLRAADQGHAVSLFSLGHLHGEGRAVPKDGAEDCKWYRKGAEKRYASAALDLAECYRFGTGVSKNKDEALKWLRKAAQQDKNPRTAARAKNCLARWEGASSEAEKPSEMAEADTNKALLEAADKDNLNEVKRLLDQGADVNAGTSVFTRLYIASQEGHKELVKLFRQNKAHTGIRVRTIRGHPTALVTASRQGRREIVKLLLEHGADPSLRTRMGTALEIAAKKGHTEVVKVLNSYASKDTAHLPAQDNNVRLASDRNLRAQYSFDEDARDVSGNGNNGTVHEAVHVPNGKVRGAYKFNGVNTYIRIPRSSDLDITSPLTMCAWILPRKNDGLRAILEKEMDNTGYNLYISNGKYHMRIDRAYLDSGYVQLGKWSHLAGVYDGNSIRLYVNGQIVGKKTARSLNVKAKDLYIGSCAGKGRFFDGLIDEVYIIDRALTAAEIMAISRSDVLETRTSMEAAADEKNKALLEAAEKGNLDEVKRLLDQGADIEARDDREATPLAWAARKGRLKVVRLLVAKGAKVNAEDRIGCTALRWACCHGHLNIAKLLLDNGADIHTKTGGGSTALMCASYQGRSEVVRFLLDKGLDTNEKEDTGQSALMWAAKGASPQVAKILISRGADINAKDNKGKSALDHALVKSKYPYVEKRRGEVAKVLKKHQAKRGSELTEGQRDDEISRTESASTARASASKAKELLKVYTKAMGRYRKAADKGHTEAKKRLKELETRGSADAAGTKKDKREGFSKRRAGNYHILPGKYIGFGMRVYGGECCWCEAHSPKSRVRISVTAYKSLKPTEQKDYRKRPVTKASGTGIARVKWKGHDRSDVLRLYSVDIYNIGKVKDLISYECKIVECP